MLFKHVSKFKDQPNWVLIKMYIREEYLLVFEVTNSQSNEEVKSQDAVQYSGLGLKNVQRRLDLIYPELHQLDIVDQQHYFSVQLRLELSEKTNAPVNHLLPELVTKQ